MSQRDGDGSSGMGSDLEAIDDVEAIEREEARVRAAVNDLIEVLAAGLMKLRVVERRAHVARAAAAAAAGLPEPTLPLDRGAFEKTSGIFSIAVNIYLALNRHRGPYNCVRDNAHVPCLWGPPHGETVGDDGIPLSAYRAVAPGEVFGHDDAEAAPAAHQHVVSYEAFERVAAAAREEIDLNPVS